ncbi:unnamed protein product [Moneuplotes crassus]|uniref:Uncharacterized protein n=1 Tax=Euplotes crassus TaxID=5936 RepID=A0AAD1U6W7_EUPCR|nr:unnamed protein product [Moneuplotes crassus]
MHLRNIFRTFCKDSCKTIEQKATKSHSKFEQKVESFFTKCKALVEERTLQIEGIFNSIQEETKRRKRDTYKIRNFVLVGFCGVLGWIGKVRCLCRPVFCHSCRLPLEKWGRRVVQCWHSLYSGSSAPGEIGVGMYLIVKMKKTGSLFLFGDFNESGKPSKEYNKSINHVRKANSRERLKLSSVVSTRKDYNVVTVDKDCYSCSNSNQVVLKAFKMACLSYYPSSITYENKVVSRSWLHFKRSEIIKNIYSDYHNLLPWKSGNLEYEKYLEVPSTDLQYTTEMNPFTKETNMNRTLEISSHLGSLSRRKLTMNTKVDKNIEVHLPKEDLNNNLDQLKLNEKKKLEKIFTSTHVGFSQLSNKSSEGFKNLKMLGKRMKTPNDFGKRGSFHKSHKFIREKRRNISQFKNISPHVTTLDYTNRLKVSRNHSEGPDPNSEYGDDFKYVENLE